MTDPRPLVPVNPEGLSDLVDELLVPTAATPLPTPSNRIIFAPSFITDPEQYIGIPQLNRVIAKKETYKNLNWESTIKALAKQETLYMPTIPEFMTHFFNVREAAQKRGTLYDGRGNPIRREEAVNLYKYFTTDFEEGCCTWLNAEFVEGSGALKLDLRADFRVNAKGKIEYRSVTPLEASIEEYCYVDLRREKFNKQFLPTIGQKSSNQNYKVDENIYFYPPGKNTVARFRAGSGRAGFYCFGVPSYSDDSLGVFACAEGAARENTRGKS